MSGTLYLIPASLGESDWRGTLPATAREVVCGLDRFIVENAKSARAELKRLGHPKPLRDLRIDTLPEKPDSALIDALLAAGTQGHAAGLMSEAGCPGVADPGAAVVRRAHELGIRVVPLVGPSSILLALMASGLEGQRFAFHGYLPVKDIELRRRIEELEAASRRDACTQVFIETPYRNDRLFRALVETAAATTRLAIATDLTLATESIASRLIADWRRLPPPLLDRRPSVFLLLAQRDAR